MEGIATIVSAYIKLLGDTEKTVLNRDHYPVFNTDETCPEKFWDSLNKGKFFLFGRRKQYYKKIEVGSLAVDQGFMTANYGFNCSSDKYKDLSKRQQKIIKLALSCKNEIYTPFSLRGMCGKLFRV